MIQLVKEITKGLLEQSKKTVAVYGGGFKPPTKGHFQVVKQALDENPEIDEFLIYVGKKDRDGVTQEDAMKIWGIYRNYLPYKVKIRQSTQAPIKEIYDYAKEHPDEEVLWVIGAREENEADFADIASRTKSITKYPNLELRTIVTKGGVSGTAARNASKVSPQKLNQYLPDFLSSQEKNNIYVILSNEISEKQTLNENATYSQHIDVKQKIKELTKHMLDKGMNIKPLPKVIFKNGNAENAKQFLGKTAYYDPDNREIVLYTEGRHPKDIVRSFSHEMIHHIQNLENRLGNITTTNTMEDDHLDKLEQEANLGGTMTFRNWTDSLQESKKKDPFGLNAYAQELARLREIKYSNPNFDAEWEEAIRYPEFKEKGKNTWLKIAKQGHTVNYSDIKNVLGNVDLNFKDLEEPKKQRFQAAFQKGVIEMPIAVKFSDKDYDLVAGNTRLSGLVKKGIDPKIWIVDISSLNEQETIQLDKSKVKIYLDMDGVVADFDKRFTDLAGMSPNEFEAKYGKDLFWDFIDEGDNKVRFWVGIPPMEGAKRLVDYVSKHNYVMLTAPSIKKQSRLGKLLWIRNHTGDIFPSKPKVIFKAAKEKHLVKPSLTEKDILIDDKASTIDNWNAAGGTGILYQSAPQVISTLKKIGL